MPAEEEMQIDYLRVYPGLNDFSDTLESVPLSVIGEITRLKEAAAKEGTMGTELHERVGAYFEDRDVSRLAGLEGLLDALLPTLVEKMQVASQAAEALAREVQRLDANYAMICENEIPPHIQQNPDDPAFLEIVPIEKQASARAQARREARESREARRQAQQESRAGSRVGTPAQSGADVPKRRPVRDTKRADRRAARDGGDTESEYDAPRREPRRAVSRARERVELAVKPERAVTPQRIQPVVQPVELRESVPAPVQPPHAPLVPHLLAQVGPADGHAGLHAGASLNARASPAFAVEPATLAPPPPGFAPPAVEPQPSPAVVEPLVQPAVQHAAAGSATEQEVVAPAVLTLDRSASSQPHSPAPPDAQGSLPPVVMPVARSGPNDTAGVKRKHSVPGSEPTYCYCERASFGEMVGCDGPNCEREWFHLGCIGLSALPKGQWFCAECRVKMRRK